VPGPAIGSITVTPKKLTATGTGFVAPVTVLVNGVSFQAAAKLKAGNTRAQVKGRLTNGQSIAEAIPSGVNVMITFRNGNGGETTLPFRRP
jgi:hypothetical protein